MKKIHSLSTLGILSLACLSTAYAAKPIDLSHQPASLLQTFAAARHTESALSGTAQTQAGIKEVSREEDAKGTTHIRIQQLYQGIPVWSGNAVLHTANRSNAPLPTLITARTQAAMSMNGIFYQGLEKDLASISTTTFGQSQKAAVLKRAIQLFHTQHRVSSQPSNQTAEPIIFTDKKDKAHPAYLVSFIIQDGNSMPKKPTYIIDAVTMETYQEWDDVKTLEAVKGGGIGGNEGVVGKVIYDGAPNHFPALSFERDSKNKICYLRNAQLIVTDKRSKKTPQFDCAEPDKTHNNLFWNTSNDYANGGYSPNNDAIYSDYIVRQMYLDWFDVIMLKQYPEKKDNRTPWKIKMITHDPQEGQNAWWLDGTMAFGEGDNESYPVVAPSVVAHELSHGFTQQQSGLVYYDESGGLNESFSDMADKAVEYYVYGKNTWTIDPELLKVGGRLLRYMDEPTKDCAEGQKPGEGCSIARYNDYNDSINVHHSSGIFNRAFYLLSQKWNTKKAFEVMVHANRFYWTPTTSFHDAACDVLSATKYYQYDLESVRDVMKQVDINTSRCKI